MLRKHLGAQISKFKANFRRAFGESKEAPAYFVVDASLIRYEHGFGFGEYYHPYVEAIKLDSEVLAGELLHEFFRKFDTYLNSYSSNLDIIPVQAWKLKLGELRRQIAARNYRLGQLEHGTLTPQESSAEKAKRLYCIKKSIEAYGFEPSFFSSDGISGVRLGSGFLLLGGQHRATVLYGMGEKKFRVRIKTRHGHMAIDRHGFLDVGNCHIVQSGMLSADQVRSKLAKIESGILKSEAVRIGFPFSDSV